MPESTDAHRRADSRRNEERILAVAKRLPGPPPAAPLPDIAAAAGVSRSTLYRHFPDRAELIARLDERPEDGAGEPAARSLPPRRLGPAPPLSLPDRAASPPLHPAGAARLGELLDAPFAVGPELDADGIARVRERIERPGEVEVFALWLRGRAIGAFL